MGRGRITFADGGKLTGPFAEDRAEGQAEYEDAAGNHFQCEGQVKTGT